MSGIGLVWNPASPSEAVGHYSLAGVGSLRVEGKWDAAAARAGDGRWRFVYTRQDAAATDAAGRLVGEYRGRAHTLSWNSQVFQLWQPSFLSRIGRYTVADGDATIAVLDTGGAFLRPVNIEVSEHVSLEPGLMLFVAFLGGSLGSRDANNDGL